MTKSKYSFLWNIYRLSKIKKYNVLGEMMYEDVKGEKNPLF